MNNNTDTPMELNAQQISRICRSVEQSLGHALNTPRDFDKLSESIFARTGALLSRNTLRRLWGRIDEGTHPRRSTIVILLHFLGYRDAESFLREDGNESEALRSGIVMRRHLSVSADLHKGNRLRLTWQPGRVCDVEYLGNLYFRVTASERTRLQPGDTFLCNLIIEGEPLYLDQLRHAGNVQQNTTPMSYVCGMDTGVWYEFL